MGAICTKLVLFRSILVHSEGMLMGDVVCTVLVRCTIEI